MSWPFLLLIPIASLSSIFFSSKSAWLSLFVTHCKLNQKKHKEDLYEYLIGQFLSLIYTILNSFPLSPHRIQYKKKERKRQNPFPKMKNQKFLEHLKHNIHHTVNMCSCVCYQQCQKNSFHGTLETCHQLNK